MLTWHKRNRNVYSFLAIGDAYVVMVLVMLDSKKEPLFWGWSANGLVKEQDQLKGAGPPIIKSI